MKKAGGVSKVRNYGRGWTSITVASSMQSYALTLLKKSVVGWGREGLTLIPLPIPMSLSKITLCIRSSITVQFWGNLLVQLCPLWKPIMPYNGVRNDRYLQDISLPTEHNSRKGWVLKFEMVRCLLYSTQTARVTSCAFRLVTSVVLVYGT